MNRLFRMGTLLASLAMGAVASTALAQTPAASPLEFSGSGFLTVAAGKVVGGTQDAASNQGWACPCFIADYAQGGVFESGRWRLGPDSKLGLQGQVSTSGGQFGLTGQVVARGARNGRMNLEWLYATAELGGDWTLQIGRKRLPLFVSSEVQDVGFATPWVHLSPQVYGWETVNFNGASLTWRHQVGAWLAHVNVIAGSESARDSGYWRLYNGKHSRTDTRWSRMRGAEVKVAADGLEARAVVIASNTQNRIFSDGELDFSDPLPQRIYGLSFTADLQQWVGRGEFLYINREQDYGRDRALLVAAGRRMGPWLPMVSWSRYRQITGPTGPAAEGHDVGSLSLRRDIGQSHAVKVQWDDWRDRSAPGFSSMHGNAWLISLSYDRVF